MTPIRVFWTEEIPTGRMTVSYKSDESLACPNGSPGMQYHHARVTLSHHATKKEWDDADRDQQMTEGLLLNPICSCGYVFTQENAELSSRGFACGWRNPITGEEWDNSNLPAGAMYDAKAYHDIPHWCSADGIALHVVLPDGTHWHVDGEANNCTRKGDHSHKCWPRHGDPRKGECHVDKNGNTCSAGAGSIQTGSWHGFLHNNHLIQC